MLSATPRARATDVARAPAVVDPPRASPPARAPACLLTATPPTRAAAGKPSHLCLSSQLRLLCRVEGQFIALTYLINNSQAPAVGAPVAPAARAPAARAPVARAPAARAPAARAPAAGAPAAHAPASGAPDECVPLGPLLPNRVLVLVEQEESIVN